MPESQESRGESSPPKKRPASQPPKGRASKEKKKTGLGSLKRRDILVLGAFWVTAACVMVLLVGFFILRQSELSRQPQVPAPTRPLEAGEFTALQLYPLAEETAVDWMDDVQFVSASAVWSNESLIELSQPIDWFQQLSEPVEWVYRFYSPGLQRILFVIVTPDKQIIARPHLDKVRREARIIDTAGWQVDHPIAVGKWLNDGGAAWLGGATNPIVTAQLAMDVNNSVPLWTITALNPDNDQSTSYTVPANQP